MNRLEQIVLTLDEFEALRLIDSDGLDQGKAAVHLGVSRATCARIVESAHKKVADAITRGMAIEIHGGSFDFRLNRFLCIDCGHSWEVAPEGPNETGTVRTECPSCGGGQISSLAERYGQPRHRGRHGRGRGHGGNNF